MPSRTKLAFLFFVATALPAATFTYHIAGDQPGPWPQILSSIGLERAAGGPANLFIVRAVTPGSVPQWIQRVEQGGIVVVEGDNELAAALGFKPTEKHVVIRSIVDLRAPKLGIVWENSAETPVFELPKDARVFATERWTKAPVMASVRRGSGAALWIATAPGKEGYERFPYLLQALADLGVEPPLRSHRLWAFFDGAYRSRVDLDYFAKRWRAAGIGALHVAGWHYYESNAENDAYLRRLIEACHRQAILVYVWLELPHVSEQFWADHPEWREKTAILQDAQLDWRKLMNLQNAECRNAVRKEVSSLLERFDWDGVNLAELYFESLEGAGNPSRFTPLNDDVRKEFQKTAGFDPKLLFTSPAGHESEQAAALEKGSLERFLQFRAELAARLQTEWMD